MFNSSFTYYRLFDHLVLTNGKRTHMLAGGYEYLKQFRGQALQTTLEDALLKLFLERGNSQMKRCILYLVLIGFIECRIPPEYSTSFQEEMDVYPGKFDEMNHSFKQSKLPDKLLLEVEAACNYSCEHCERSKSPATNDNNEFDREYYDQLFSDFEELGGREIYFTGGEPMLNAHIDEILELTCNYGFGVTILSNGSLFHADQFSLLHMVRLRKVQISLMGTQKEYKRIAEAQTYHTVLNTLNALKSRALPYSVVCPITRTNVSSYHFMKKLAQDHPLDIVLMDETQAPSIYNCPYKFFTEPNLANARPDICYSEVIDRFKRELQKSCSREPDQVFINVAGDMYQGCLNKLPMGNLYQNRFLRIWTKIPECEDVGSSGS